MFSSSALLNQGLNSNYRKERRACVFCGLSNHKSHKCLKVTNPSARKEATKCNKNKNCFVCFEIGHNGNLYSREDYKCKNCNGKHNFSVCTFNKNPLQSRFDNLINPSSNNLANNQANVLLQTALVKVGDLHLQKQSKVNVFVIYLRIDKSYTIYLKLLSRFPNSQITVT